MAGLEQGDNLRDKFVCTEEVFFSKRNCVIWVHSEGNRSIMTLSLALGRG